MPNRFSPGDVIGAYRMLGKLGSGGMGAVLEVESLSEGERYALKYCTEDDEISVRRFAREVRAMERVAHPNVVPVLGRDLDNDPPFFLMPIANGSLDAEIPTLSEDHEAALEAFLQLCAGVKAVHESIGPHRDLKPYNALRMDDGTVAVSDFGLVKIDPRDTTVLTRTAALLGTDLYMAPEQRMPGGARDADCSVDVYSLGATLYHLLTGKFPAVIDTSELNPMLGRIVRKATSLPRERYDSVDALMTAVTDHLRLMRSPTDPLGVFSDRLKNVKDRLAKRGKYSLREVGLLMDAVRGLLEDEDTLLEEFDGIPDVILEKAAKRAPDPLTDALDAYCRALDARVGWRGFSYAEAVADRMRLVARHTDTPGVVAQAVRATLIAAVDLNRFAAMDTLELVLADVTDDDAAKAVADVLRDEADRFSGQAERYRRSSLHPHLRDVVRESLLDSGEN